MEGRHMMTVIKNFRSLTNKILVDYGKFKGWLLSKLKEMKKLANLKLTDPRKALLYEMFSAKDQKQEAEDL
jgi:hypothetical protein